MSAPPIAIRRRSSLAVLGALIGIVVLGSISLVGLAGPAGAQQDQFASVEVEIIGPVSWEAGRPVDARVVVETRRPISGTLQVVSTPEGQGTTTYEFDVDLAADATASFPVTLTSGWNGVEVEATVTSGGDVVADDRVTRFGNAAAPSALVAVFGIDDPPQRVAPVGGGDQLPVLDLDARLRGLERASTLVTTAAAVAELAEDSPERLKLDGWLQGGGQLIVDDRPRSLDERFHRFPTANPDRFLVGAGSLVYLEDWEDGLPLGGYLGTSGLRDLVESQNLGVGAGGELALLANLTLPAVALVAGVLFVYTVLSGPLLFGFLSARRQQRRIWVVLPALSLLFALGIVGFGFLNRSGRQDAHITIVEVSDRGSRATSSLLLTSSVGGDKQLETPATWSYLGQGRRQGQRPVKLRLGELTNELTLVMPPGSNAVARLGGSTPQFDGALTIDEVRRDGDAYRAEVTNNATVDLQEAIAFLGNARSEIGAIAAGETVEFTVAAEDESGRTMKELLLWPRSVREWGNDGPVAVPADREAVTAAGAWTEWRVEQGLSATSPGVLGVAAWTDELPGPIADVDLGRTALFARTNLPADEAAAGFGLTARLPQRGGEPFFDGNFAGFIEDYRLTLPPDYDLDRYTVRADDTSGALGFLTPDGWRYVELPPNGRFLSEVPPEAVIDGEVVMRSYVAEWSWGRGLSVTVMVDSDDARPPTLVDELDPRFVEGGFAREVEFAGPPIPRAAIEQRLAEVTVGPEAPFEDADLIEREAYVGYEVALTEGQQLVATMSAGRGDSFLELLDSSGALLVSNDDYGQGVDSQIVFVAPTEDTYEVRAHSLSGDPIDYTIVIEVADG